ncbi:HAD hydrolase-like protein, partial [Pediococcus acidilactici]|nr:HAD hydrolase-like protein [Pediococcus acidilactici]
MKKAFIFDMDGVLIRSEEFYFERRMRFFKENNLSPGSSDIDDYIGVSNEKVWENLVSEPSERERIRTKYQPFLEKNKINYQEY